MVSMLDNLSMEVTGPRRLGCSMIASSYGENCVRSLLAMIEGSLVGQCADCDGAGRDQLGAFGSTS